jgi:hypothetical protein
LICEAITLTRPGRVLRLRYEDLRDHPVESVAWLGEELGLPLGDVAQHLAGGKALAVGHNLGGNAIRHEQTVRFDSHRERAQSALPRWVAAMTVLLCWPLMLRYRFPLY